MLSRKDPALSVRSNFVAGSICLSRTLSYYSIRNWTRWRRRRYTAVNQGQRRNWEAIYPFCQKGLAALDPSILHYHDRRWSVSAADGDCWMADQMLPISAACKGWCRTISSMTSLLSKKETAWIRWSKTPRGCSSIGELPLQNCKWESNAKIPTKYKIEVQIRSAKKQKVYNTYNNERAKSEL